MRKLTVAWLLTSVLLSSAVKMFPQQGNQATPITPSIRTVTALSKTVVFITVKVKKAGQVISLRGTGFLVGIPDSTAKDTTFIYLITNRHIAEAIDQDEHGKCVKLPIQQMSLTYNDKEAVNGNRSRELSIPLSQQYHWYFPEDKGVDLALLPVTPEPKADYMWVNVAIFLNPETPGQQPFIPGDRVLTAGYFYHFAGLRQIQPIVREGVLAMLPDGPMLTTTCKRGKVYLADVHATPGMSGSPIFLSPLGAQGDYLTPGGGVPYGLLGVVSGYMIEDEHLTLRASTTWKGSVRANSGISVVVPAEQLKALLYSSDVQKLRDQAIAARANPKP